VGQHRSASGSALLGLDGFEVTGAEVAAGEWQLTVQTTARVVGCVGCGMQAELHGRRTVGVRDRPAGGRPVVLAWRKRIWGCREPACAVRTWTERTAAIRPGGADPAGPGRGLSAGRHRRPRGRAVARDLGVGWVTVLRAVADHGQPLVDDPARLDGVAALGLDETSVLGATPTAPTREVTGLVEVEGGRLLDVIADRTARAVTAWLGARPRSWRVGVGTVALDPGAGLPAPWLPRWGMPAWSWTTSTPSRWPTPWSTRSAGGPSRPPSGTGAARAIRCTGSASCWWLPPSSSPAGDAGGGGLGWRSGSDRRGGGRLAGQGAAARGLRRRRPG
jgi:zinc-finger of transposase IS204/IS1001/IS1096/IS1165